MLHLEAANIARNTDFQLRVNMLTVKAALAKLAAADPPQADILLGQRILNGSESVERWAMGAITNPAILAGAHAEDGSTISDNDLEFTINSLWPAFSK